VPARGPAAPASSSQPPGYRGPEGGVCGLPPPPRDPWGSISGLGFGRRRPLAAAAAAPSGLLLPASRLSRPGRRGLRSPSHAANYGEFHAQEPQPERDNAEEQDDASEGHVLLLLPAFELITLILPNPIAVTSDKIIARRRCIGTCATRGEAAHFIFLGSAGGERRCGGRWRVTVVTHLQQQPPKPSKQKAHRKLPQVIMDDNQIMIPGNMYQTWLKDTSNLVSKRRKVNTLTCRVLVLFNQPR